MKKWLVFIIVVGLSLVYGLMYKDRTVNQTQHENEHDTHHVDGSVINRPVYETSQYKSSELVKREVVLMGSQFIFVIEAPEKLALQVITKITENLLILESKISSWKPGSDVFLLNQQSGKWIKVSQQTMSLLLLSKQAFEDTDGDFDVTIGAVWDLYPFRDQTRDLPGDKQIQQQLQFVGTDKIELNQSEMKVRIPEGMKINLGGIGKGYAAQLAISLLREMGIKNAAVSAGGDVYLMGKKSSGPWNISIENPRWQGQIIEQFSIADYAVATSGDSQRYIKSNGKRYSHIINPKTGKPANGTQSVTILTKDAALADAYATAVSVKGAIEGMRWVNGKENIEALIIDDNSSVARSTGWETLTKGFQ
ncbi:MAG: FAD:protein FMN transferase [Gammaproteobacteria bacterium]|nr:FAD:protein FMN transferase [Gammaproteobacteria bacterium]